MRITCTDAPTTAADVAYLTSLGASGTPRCYPGSPSTKCRAS